MNESWLLLPRRSFAAKFRLLLCCYALHRPGKVLKYRTRPAKSTPQFNIMAFLSANSRRTHVGRDWAGGRPPAPSTLAPTLTPALPRGSQDSSGAADWRSRGFQGRELLLRRIGRKDANKPVVGPSFLGLFFTVASHWDAWQTTAAGLPCSDPRPWRLGSRWSSDIPDGVEESATP
jgi:hypothetical protein